MFFLSKSFPAALVSLHLPGAAPGSVLRNGWSPPRQVGQAFSFRDLESEMLMSRLKSLFTGDEDIVESDPLERRIDPRRKVLLKAEVFPILQYADLKIVNASRTGFAGESSIPLFPSHPLIFSVDANNFYLGTIRWVKGKRFGVDLADALGILGYSDEVDPGFLLSHQSRARRYPVELTGRIALGTGSHQATVRDVSQSGLRLELDAPLAQGQEAIVRLRDRPLILSLVQWRANGMIGVKMAERMQTLRLAYSTD
jgi:hypothetical protein